MSATRTRSGADRMVACDAPVRGPDGLQRCGRPAWRTYRDTSGIERGFCTLASHAWATTDAHTPVPGTQRRVTADHRPEPVITRAAPRRAAR
jgi:hypothetical protein